MLFLASGLNQLNFSSLMAVYEETNQKSGQTLLQAELNFYQYLSQCFFTTSGAVYAIWQEKGQYISALRLEPYQDGLLLAALETMPAYRNQGYGEKLIRAVQEQFPQKIYSHVSRRNAPSLTVHQKCGFAQILDYAKYIDGSVDRNAVTLLHAKIPLI